MATESHGRRVLVFGWGAAAEAVLREFASHSGSGLATLFCISHGQQAADCDLREVCKELGFACELSDDATTILALAQAFRPDLIVSASYRQRLPGTVLALCRDAVNFHPSLLPKHRGCWSGFWAIFEGDAETGVTCHRMVEEFDRGLILHQEPLEIQPLDTSFSLYRRLLPVTAICAREVARLYFGPGLPPGREQEGPSSYHFRKLPFQGLIQPEWSDIQVERFIRAMHFPPFEGAAALIAGQRLLVESLAHYHQLSSEASAALTAAPERIATADGAVPAAATEGGGSSTGRPVESSSASAG